MGNGEAVEKANSKGSSRGSNHWEGVVGQSARGRFAGWIVRPFDNLTGYLS